jgi:predicted DCC family thiol-disulfide oxidoreductase YuxK
MRDERAAAAVESVPEDVRFTTFHLISPDGRGFSGGDAVIETMRAIRSTSSLARLLRPRPLRGLVGVFYASLARSKGFFGRFVKDAPGPERWP